MVSLARLRLGSWSPSGSSGPFGSCPSCPSWLLDAEARARPTMASALALGKHALHWASGRTGLPVVVIAALAIVVTWRVARRTWHIAFELAVAVTLLLVAARLGWIRW